MSTGILASSKPIRERSPREHVCPRCGFEFEDTKAVWLPSAPCTDCREYLVEHEGHNRDEWRRRPRGAAA